MMSSHRSDLKINMVPTNSGFANQSRSGLNRIACRTLDAAHVWFQTSAKGRPVYLLGRLSLGLAALTGLLLAVTIVAFAKSDPTRAWTLLLVATGCGLCSLGCLATGVSLELLIETHKATITGRRLRVASELNESSEPNAAADEPLRQAA
jgi:hypothetical protein